MLASITSAGLRIWLHSFSKRLSPAMPNSDLFVVVVFLFGGCLFLVFVLFLIILGLFYFGFLIPL